MNYLKNKRILVTGACGTVGRELVRQALEEFEVAECIGIDNNESELFFLDQEFGADGRGKFFLGDVRDRDKLMRRLRGVDVVFHAAALKHVGLCERSPFEAVQSNILAIQNLVGAACENGVERVVFTSSDKAVNPTNVMGTSKLMGERLISAANTTLHGDGPVFVSTRFGNVLGSRGSVLPIFRRQIAQGGPVTLTDREMTRFVMSCEQAVRLVLDSARLGCGGEVLITKMPVVRIEDLANVMIERLAPKYGHDPANIEIQEIGAKPGEKMYEELMSQEETGRTWELDRYFVVRPAFPSLYRDIEYDYENLVSREVTNPYNSSLEPALSRDEVARFLEDNGLLEPADCADEPAERNFP